MEQSPTVGQQPYARSSGVLHPHASLGGVHPGLPAPSDAKRHILTVNLEDYFQVGAFNRLIQRGQWYRFEPRLERSTRNVLALLDEYGIHATFFVLGWVADALPELVRAVAERGHEIASKGYYHRSIRELSPGEFRDDLSRSSEALERASGHRVRGYRVSDSWFRLSDLWALDVLAECGYEYDSSIGPLFRSYAAEPWRRFTHPHLWGDKTLWEFPISTADVFGCLVPIAGGNYFRQIPHALVSRAVARWHRTYTAPFVMYFHTWELDPEQPKIGAAPWIARVRQYRNLERMPSILQDYFRRYRFTGVADHLGLSTAPLAPATEGPPPRRATPATGVPILLSAGRERREGDPEAAGPMPVTVVVPCHNEELILPYLANTLRSVERTLALRYAISFLFVDDGSTDGTWGALQRLFGARANCTLVRHDRNRGVAAGILTGIRHATTEVVCSIDCDCTYDPHELGRMIPLLAEGVDLVTASPYHPSGGVRNVPHWRLCLSKSLSALYRRVLTQKLSTYTSCFRVYRRSAVLAVHVRRTDFLGIAELLGRLDLAGSRVVEHPAVLEVRMLGRSKMKVVKTIAGHLRLLLVFAYRRASGGDAQTRPAATPAVATTPATTGHAGRLP